MADGKKTYTEDEIKEMRALNMDKPPEVSWPDWMGPQKISHVHQAMIYAAAAGATNKQIADELGFTEHRMSIILNKTTIKKEIKAVQDKHWGANAEQRFKNLMPHALDVYERIVKDPNHSARDQLNAADRITDRALGKVAQSINVEGNLLGDLISRLDQQGTRDVTQPALPLPKDDVDEFVDSFVTEEFTVGKRDKNV